MIKDNLKTKEPTVYKCLDNALKNNRVAHSYLFTGEYNPLKIETAYLLAQSIIEGLNDFACETCDTCKRIRNNEYSDVIFIDGYDKTIKKDEIEIIMDGFSKTALEKAGKKIYILANINNSSTKVLNMLLKFMEEPSNDNTYGIFITDNKDGLLPTIVSRCQEINFKTRDFSYLIDKYLAADFTYTDAYLLSNIFHRYDDEFLLNDERFLCAKEFVYKTIDSLDQKAFVPVLYSRDFYTRFKDRNDFKICADYYLAIMIKMIEDALVKKGIDDDEYNDYLYTLSNYDLAILLQIFKSASDKVSLNAERKLLFDSIASEIISYI